MKIITAVPESITREQYRGLVAGVGFHVDRVQKLEFRPDGVYAEVTEPGLAGGSSVAVTHDTASGEAEPVVNTVWIPVKD